ncbi:hypothetical protein BGZ97_000837 [Linnemannia gamsii]|uniref:DH domain-containing protein n=1 Tax=Linnemannia gamsii TaxID=64522 RepID=A0A9P6QXF9_9FUNG|nr:hypothetical protein BGZ97_000837 [Linnemannia gamsii]
MRTNDYTSVLIDKRGLARDQLNLPIARVPIDIQSSMPMRLTQPVGKDKAGLRISLPRQPAALPKLHVKIPVVLDINAHFALFRNTENTNNELYDSSNDYYYYQGKGGQYSPYSASSSKAANRCASWSPSQGIPEGHYSKGFTLTSFQKVIDKHHQPLTASTSSSTAPSSTSSHTAAAVVSLKRSNTSHPHRRVSTTLTPFQRLVGRSKSLKVKTPAALINNIIMETENPVLPSEGFASFHTTLVTSPTTTNTPHTINASNSTNNNNNNNRPKSVSPRLSRIIHNYETRPDAAGGDKNSPGDASKHSNTIQSQGSRNAAPFASNNNKRSHSNSTHIVAGVSALESERGAPTIIPTTPTSTKANITIPPASTTTVTNTTLTLGGKNVTSKPNRVNSNSNSASHEQDQPVAKAVLVSESQQGKAGLSVSVNAHKPAIATMCVGPCKPLWQHTRTNADEIRALGLTNQEIQKQETIFELIYTESEYLDDLKNMHKLFVEELNVKMAEARRKKRSSPDKADVKLYERLARLLSHIKDLWNGHQSLLRSLQNKQECESPVVEDIGSVFESFYMFTIYDSYFAQYTTSSRDFQHISSGNSELCLIIRNLLKAPVCKSLSMEGIFLKPIQRLQKYPLFFKDLMNLTPKDDPDYAQLEHALSNHQKGLTKIDDRIWIEEHNEMLKDLQLRIKGLPSNFSLVEKHRYLILDGPVYRVATRQPSKFSFGKHSSHKSEGHGLPISSSMEWRDRFKAPGLSFDAGDDAAPILIHRPSQLDYHHQHAKPAFSPTPPSSLASSASSSQSGLASPSILSSPFPSGSNKMFTPRAKSYIDPQHHDSFQKSGFSYQSSSSPPSATTLHSLSSVPSPISIPNPAPKQPSVSQLVSHYNFNLSSSFSNFTSIGGAGHPRNTSSSALHLPGMIKNSTDVEAEYHVFVFTDIVLWTKRVMSRYHRKEGVPWNFKLVEPVSRLTSVCNTSEDA